MRREEAEPSSTVAWTRVHASALREDHAAASPKAPGAESGQLVPVVLVGLVAGPSRWGPALYSMSLGLDGMPWLAEAGPPLFGMSLAPDASLAAVARAVETAVATDDVHAAVQVLGSAIERAAAADPGTVLLTREQLCQRSRLRRTSGYRWLNALLAGDPTFPRPIGRCCRLDPVIAWEDHHALAGLRAAQPEEQRRAEQDQQPADAGRGAPERGALEQDEQEPGHQAAQPRPRPAPRPAEMAGRPGRGDQGEQLGQQVAEHADRLTGAEEPGRAGTRHARTRPGSLMPGP